MLIRGSDDALEYTDEEDSRSELVDERAQTDVEEDEAFSSTTLRVRSAVARGFAAVSAISAIAPKSSSLALGASHLDILQLSRTLPESLRQLQDYHVLLKF